MSWHWALPAAVACGALIVGVRRTRVGARARVFLHGLRRTKNADLLLRRDDVVVDRQLADATDVDLFAYGEIAGRVAELVAVSDQPVHIGIFGAWGTGKSSFLTLVQRRFDQLAGQTLPDGTKLSSQFRIVRYDAWRYGGQALRRDLIAVAARELKIRRRRYRAGLFESRQVVRIEVDELLQRLWAFLVGIVFLAFGFLLASLLGIAVLWIGSQFSDAVWTPAELLRDHLPNWSKLVGWVAAGLAVLSAPNLLGVTVNRSSPSQDDEFARNLNSLIREAEVARFLRPLLHLGWPRALIPRWLLRKVVFFIDELDRASDSEVLDTLTALQTQFADAEVSVLVAADREVIEKALANKDAQRRPEREWDPYLSGSDAFLDKVFQHSFVLPPLRTERITAFARELVDRDEGLWAEIADEGCVDDVLYALIPSHVHSPRRIKVLLNAYATQSRVAQARGLQVSSLRLQLAVWVVLQLEFPDFAADLKLEQRLRGLVLAKSDEVGGKVGRMLANHRSIEEPKADAKDHAWVDWSRRNQLFNFLERTRHLPDIPFDLLFLETAGSAIGQFPEEVAGLLDIADSAEPSRVLSALEVLDEEIRDRATLFLADKSRIAISVGRDRVIEVMAGLIERHSSAEIPHSAAALEAFRPYSVDRPVPADAVIGQIRTCAESAPTELRDVLAQIDEREDVPAPPFLAERLTLPEQLSEHALEVLAAWSLSHLTTGMLTTLVREDQHVLVEAAIAKDADQFIATLLEQEQEQEQEEAEQEADPAEEIDDEVQPDPEAGIEPLDETELADWLAKLSGTAGNSLASRLRVHLEPDEEAPRLAAALLVSSSVDELHKGELATSILISDPHPDDLTALVDSAISSDDEAQKANAAVAIIGGLSSSEATADRRLVLGQAARLLTPDNLPEVALGVTQTLDATEWPAEALAHRSEFGHDLLEWMDSHKLPGLSATACAEILAAIPHAVAGDLPIGKAFTAADLLSVDAAMEVDEALQAEATGAAAVRQLNARLVLRRLSGQKLPTISPTEVGRGYHSNKDDNDPSVSVEGRRLVDEWLAIPRTDKDVIALTKAARTMWSDRVAGWMRTVTPVQATNVWLFATNNYGDGVVEKLTMAVRLDSAKSEARIRELATSHDAEDRQKALRWARYFPPGRADSDRVVQAVAAELKNGSSHERSQALRLVSDYSPRRMDQSIRDFVLSAPKSFFTRISDRDLRTRAKKRRN